MWCWRTAASSPRSASEHGSASGRCAAAAAISASSPVSCSRRTRATWSMPDRSFGSWPTAAEVHALVSRFRCRSARRVLHVPRAPNGSSGPPFPEEHWGKKMCGLVGLLHRAAAGSREGGQRDPRRRCPSRSSTGRGRCRSGAAGPVRRALPAGLQWYWKGDFVKTLPDAAIDAHLYYTAKAPERGLPACISIPSMAPCIGESRRKRRGMPCDATWSMVIAAVDPIPARRRHVEAMGAGLLGGHSSASTPAGATRTS